MKRDAEAIIAGVGRCSIGARAAGAVGRLGSLLAVAACGFFALGTSCFDKEWVLSTTATVPFAPGQQAAAITVHADGFSLNLLLNHDVIVVRKGEPIDPTPRDPNRFYELEPKQERCRSFSELSSPGTVSVTTRCFSAALGELGHVRYEFLRSDTSDALALRVNVTATASGDCQGSFPEKLGVDVVVEPPP